MNMGQHERVTVVVDLLKNIPTYQFLKHYKEAMGLKSNSLRTENTQHVVGFLNVFVILKVHAYIELNE